MRKTLLFVCGLLAVLVGLKAYADDFTVDRNDDPDPTTANGCDDAVANDCSLRGAILKANASSLTADVVHLPAGTYTLTIPASSVLEDSNADGDLDVQGRLSIVGDGAASTVIDGNGAVTHSRVFDLGPLSSGVEMSISGVTITGGAPLVDFMFFSGFGGGVAVRTGSVTLDHVVIRDNVTGDGGAGLTSATGGGFGGGVYIEGGNVTIRSSAISGNITGKGGVGEATGLGKDDGRGGDGGGVWINLASGSVTIQDSTISDNHTGDGGPGVAVAGAAGSKGGDGGNGGGIQLLNGTLTLKNVTIANNTTGIGGDGGPGDGTHAGGNGGNGGRGGGFNADAGTLTLNNATLFGNRTERGGAGGSGTPAGSKGFNGPGGGMTRAGGTVAAGNSLLSGNSISASPIGQSSFGPDCNGNFTSNGFNLIGTGSGCAGFVAGVNNDFVDIDAKLDPAGLKDNGGDTATVAILSGSPAIDSGQNGSCETNDQRGTPRLDGDKNGTVTCDRGAFEFEICGDNQKTPGEECDDGNVTADDGCGADCRLETCGDGAVNNADEECDVGGGADDTCAEGTACVAAGETHQCTCQVPAEGTATGAGTGGATAGTAGGGGNGGGCSLLR